MTDHIDYTTYVEDAEEDSGSSVEGIASTRIYARSEVPTTPYKERPNTGKSRGADKRSNRKSDSSNTQTDSDDTPRSSKRDRDPRREYEREQREQREQRDKERRRKDRKQKEADLMQRKAREARVEAKAAKEREVKPSRKTRPTSLTQSRTEPVVQQYRRGHVEDPSCYGVPQPAASGMRPRAQTRPNSYYPGQGPPPSMGGPSGWHPAHAGQQQQPVGYPGGSYPPPPPLYGGGPSPSMIGIPASPARHSQGFFDMTMQNQTSHLKNRFERPASAIGFRQQQHAQAQAQVPAGYGYDPRAYEEEPDPRITRRASRSKKQTDDDRKRMPPPEFIPRPQSALPVGSPYRPPAHKPPTRQKSRPPTTRRGVGFADQRGVGFEEDDLLGNDDNYTEVSPEANNYDRRIALTRPRRGSVAYESPGLEIMPSRTRRDSFYGDRALGGGGVSLDEDKYLTALAYQDDVNGGTPLALTAEALRKASHRAGGGSSRSTRSSDSRDESEYKRSNTTGITRSSSSDNDNVTIKVSGSAVVRVQGAEIECGDGGEITFSAPSGSRIGSGSDRASTVYQIEDGRSRVERKTLTHRIRAPSQSDSQSRSYAQSYAPYDPTFALDDY